jgi:transcriptional regulator with XRE-family HTH domain
MNIGEIIKKLRKQKDMTQEQLAEYLNISPQAISRWEINSTLPDITLIPMLANIFDVTTDMLLGVDIDAKEKRIEAIVKEANNHLFKHQYIDAEKLLRTALKEYPNSYKLMDTLALTLYTNADYYNYKNGNEEEIITLSEKILAECTDDNLRYLSIQRLCKAYASMGETEKAVSFAKKMPNTTQRDMITETLKGTRKYNHIQTSIAFSAFNVVNSIAMLMNGSHAALDDGTEPYNSDERIALYHKIIDIINILIEKGSFGDFNNDLVRAHRKLTSLYVQKGDTAAALNHFRLAAKHAVLYDSMPPVNDDSREEYTSLLFKGVKFPSIITGGPNYIMTESLLEKSRELDSVLPASELEEIRNELRKHIAIE